MKLKVAAARIQAALRRLVETDSISIVPALENFMNGHFLPLGLLLGFLPCGLSYGAFAQALGTGSSAAGALLVLAFAAGTVPGLLLLGTGLSAIFRRSDGSEGLIGSNALTDSLRRRRRLDLLFWCNSRDGTCA